MNQFDVKSEKLLPSSISGTDIHKRFSTAPMACSGTSNIQQAPQPERVTLGVGVAKLTQVVKKTLLIN